MVTGNFPRIMRRLVLLAVLPFITACTSSDQSSSGPASSVTITLETSVERDATDIPTSMAKLQLTGDMEQTIDMRESIGELFAVNARTYEDDTVLMLTTWWAGQGEEITVTHDEDAHVLRVTRRYGDEEGSCTEPEVVATVNVPQNVTFTVTPITQTAEQSSISFCE